ncbi:hypothetical protein IMSAG250_00434 [Clostridiales bacterium]|nr:hypothetical protein IMSAG250_00434 [Clostridiales bacterium]
MDTKNFKWMNESAVENDGNKIVITAPPKTDFFKGSISDVRRDFCLKYYAMHRFTIQKLKAIL